MAGPRDQRLGQRAVEHGWLTPAELAQAIQEQDLYRGQGKAVRLGDLLVARNLLTREQLDELVGAAEATGAQAIKAERSRRTLVLAVIGGSIVALCGVLLVLLKDTISTWRGLGRTGRGERVAGAGDPERVRPTTPGGATTAEAGGKASDAPTAPARPGPRGAAKAALEAVRQYAAGHPDDIDGVHQRLRGVIEQHPEVAGEARAWQKEIEAERERQAESAWQERVQRGTELFGKGAVTEALAVFDDFPARFKNTSWGAKLGEWPETLRQQARDRLNAAADEAAALLEAGKAQETWERLQAVRPYERLAGSTDTGRMLVDLVQGLRSRAEWLARAEAQKTLAALVPDLLTAVGARDFGRARGAIEQRCASASPIVRQEARFLQSDLRGCEWTLRLLDARLQALAASGAELALGFGKAPRKGTLAKVGDGADARVRFTTGEGERQVRAADLAPDDLRRLADDTRLPPFPAAARFGLGVLALGAGDWATARDTLAPFDGPRGQAWFRQAEQLGSAQLETQMGGRLAQAQSKADAGEWKAARDLLERLREEVGWPVEGESGPRRTMADLWSKASAELLGIGDLLAGQVAVLPGDLVQVAYDWADDEQLRDWRVPGGQPRLLGTRLHCAVGTATLHEIEFPGDVEVRFRGIGAQFGVVISARGGDDGYHCWFGRDGEVQILRDGQVLGRGPFRPDPSRPYVCRVLRRGGHLQLDVDGREILGVDDQVPIAGRGRLGFLGGPGDTLYETAIVTGSFDAKTVGAAVQAQRSARKPPSSQQQLQKGRDLAGWDTVRGTWKLNRDAIEGTGTDGYCAHREASRWELADYTFSVEARRTLKTTDVPALVFPVDGKDVVWVLSKGGGFCSGLPGAQFVSDAEEVSFKFKAVTVVVKKGVVRGYIGKALVFEARADTADGKADLGGATSGIGLGCKGGTVAFRNPIFKASR